MKITRILLSVLCMLLVAGWLGACSDSDDPAAPPAEKDTTAPIVISARPEAGSTNMDVDETLQIIFNEAMDEDSAAGNLQLTGGTITGTFWRSERIIEVAHTDFAEGATVSLTVGTGLTDAAGNALADAYTAEWLTTSPDLILVNMTPGDGSTGADLNAGVILNFSDPVYTSEIESRVILTDILVTKDGNTDKVNFGFTVEEVEYRSYRLVPDADLPAETLIYVWIPSSLSSSNGKNPVDSYLLSFTTGTERDTMPPTVVSIEPADGTTNVPADQGYVRITFNEPIGDDSLEFTEYNWSFMLAMELNEAWGWEWSADHTVLTMSIRSPLPAGTPLAFTFAEFSDMAGNVQTAGFDYEVKVAGSPDYLVHQDGSYYIEGIDKEFGDLGDPTRPATDNESRWFRIADQTGGGYREVEYREAGPGEDPFRFTNGAWEAYRETSSAFQWLGWEEEIVPSKSYDFADPITMLPLPIGEGTWTQSTTLDVPGEGVYDISVAGEVYERTDFPLDSFMRGGFIADAWPVEVEIEVRLEDALVLELSYLTVYAPGLGRTFELGYEEDHEDNSWTRSESIRYEFFEFMWGDRKAMNKRFELR
ncbi:MAG: Ig-like domain-containing protein [bacterium]|nr:Ig-like domain-containing protein [bacterium]